MLVLFHFLLLVVNCTDSRKTFDKTQQGIRSVKNDYLGNTITISSLLWGIRSRRQYMTLETHSSMK